MHIIDNASADYVYLEDWIADSAIFNDEVYGDHSFHIARVPDSFNRFIFDSLESAIGSKPKVTASFLRLSTSEKDSDIRIHTDANMNSDYAWVFYFTDPPDDKDYYGTAFFSHYHHGKKFAAADKVENDRLLIKDSGDLSKFKRYSICKMKKNRLLIYSTEFFHCRYPFKGWGTDKSNGRVVSVGFFN